MNTKNFKISSHTATLFSSSDEAGVHLKGQSSHVRLLKVKALMHCGTHLECNSIHIY